MPELLLYWVTFLAGWLGMPLAAWSVARRASVARWLVLLACICCLCFRFYELNQTKDYGPLDRSSLVTTLVWSSPWLTWALYRTVRPRKVPTPTP